MATYATPPQFDLPLFPDFHRFAPLDPFGNPQHMLDNSMLPFDSQSVADYTQEYSNDDPSVFHKQEIQPQFSQSAVYGPNSSSASAASIRSAASSALGSPTLHQDFTQQPAEVWNPDLTSGIDSTGLDTGDLDFDALFPDPKLHNLSFVGESTTRFPSSSTSETQVKNAGHSTSSGLSPSVAAASAAESYYSRRGSPATVPSVAGPMTPASASATEPADFQLQSPSASAHAVPSPSLSHVSSSFSFPSYIYSSAPHTLKTQGWPGSQPASRKITSSPRPYILGSPSITTSPKPAMSDFQHVPRSSPKTRERQYFHTTSGRFVPPLAYSYPSLIQPVHTPHSLTPPILGHQTPGASSNIIPFPQPNPYPASPVGSSHSFRSGPNPYKSPRVTYPNPQWAPYQPVRRPSVYSNASRYSSESPSSEGAGDESREKERCPFPECGRRFKDLKAHMLTHQNERPEKCPIASCEYHLKGFARKYDKNRHTLTHYKGTMVCGFCPGSGSASEKSFNRADVFKRHLTSVHGVEQNPPNSRKKVSSAAEDKSSTQSSKDATGKCSTCGGYFKNAQAFYEHLDDCVLRIVQQEDPSEAINEKLLSSVSNDPDVKDTMGRHNLQDDQTANFNSADEDEDEDEDADAENPVGGGSARSGKGSMHSRNSDSHSQSSHSRGTVAKNTAGQTSGNRGSGRCGITFSKGGVALVGKSRKRRKNYPLSWGASIDKIKMKKRVVCCFDGPRRLVKDDMMLGTEYEVRMPMPGEDGRYITDLDMETLRRSEAFHGASDDDRGEWYPDNVRLSSESRTVSTPVLPPATP